MWRPDWHVAQVIAREQIYDLIWCFERRLANLSDSDQAYLNYEKNEKETKMEEIAILGNFGKAKWKTLFRSYSCTVLCPFLVAPSGVDTSTYPWLLNHNREDIEELKGSQQCSLIAYAQA